MVKALHSQSIPRCKEFHARNLGLCVSPKTQILVNWRKVRLNAGTRELTLLPVGSSIIVECNSSSVKDFSSSKIGDWYSVLGGANPSETQTSSFSRRLHSELQAAYARLKEDV
ncbi:hypothetical protein GYMLUDRAFT_68248 [Collybiopsis luxurians FD-317 M1]|nr:hypothetical protein GYMLUDRAFT_68248 [Collybiopsis luxurians FD-317 M1]